MRTTVAIAILSACTLLAACSPPKPPEEDRRPEPQAPGEAKSAIVRNANAYKDRARSAEAESLEAADRQREAIDAQTQ